MSMSTHRSPNLPRISATVVGWLTEPCHQPLAPQVAGWDEADWEAARWAVQVHGIGPFQIHWWHGLKTLDDPGAASTFTFRKGERVEGSRGRGSIRQGYASGDIIQYEVALENGTVVMMDQSDLHRT